MILTLSWLKNHLNTKASINEIIEKLNKPILLGIHLLKNGKLPSDETISEVVKKYKSSNWIGIVASCVSIEIAENSINELKIQKQQKYLSIKQKTNKNF